MSRASRAGIAAIVLTSVLWGTTGTAATFAEAGPLAIGAAALGIGGLLQAVIAVPSLRAGRTELLRHGRVVGAGGIAVAIYPLAFYSSMHLAGVAVGTVVSLASAPLVSGVLERVVDRRPLGRWWFLAAALGVAGSLLLCVPRFDGGPGSLTASAAGIGLGLVAGVSYAVYSWAAHRLMRAGVPRAASMGAVFGLGGLLLMPVLLGTGAPLVATPENTAVAAYMALVPMFAGYVLFGYGLAKVPANIATTVTLIEPAVATVLAVVIVDERLTGAGWSGLAVVGCALAVLVAAPVAGDERREPRPPV